MNTFKFVIRVAMSLASVALFGIAFSAYAAVPTVTSAKITGPNALTIIYSEPVNTSSGDYGNFMGALSNRTVTGLSGGGTNTVALTFDGGALAPDATGGLSIGTSLVSVSDHASFVAGTINATDAQAPNIVSMGVSTNSNNSTAVLAKAGDTVTLTFATNEAITTPSVNIAGHTVNASGSGTGLYSATYTLTNADAQGVIPFTIAITDIAGNAGTPLRSNLIVNAAATPTITSITSNATSSGTLKIGDSIIFALTPGSPDSSLKVLGAYNGVGLNWTTANNGTTYNATYTVASGNSNTVSPLQISGVTIANAANNTSLQASGSDVAKIIDANAPILSETTPAPTTSAVATPSYSFTSNEAGTITYAGDCSSVTTSALNGTNTIIFNTLGAGLHSNCAITVSDAPGNISNQLHVSAFTVSVPSAPPTVSEPAPLAIKTNNGFTFVRQLGLQSVGDDVRELQKRLTAEGIYNGSVTGKFGALTYQAVKTYQKKHGLKQLGILGPATRAFLNK